MGLREEEIMAYIGQEYFQSSAEEEHETCVICQVRLTTYLFLIHLE